MHGAETAPRGVAPETEATRKTEREEGTPVGTAAGLNTKRPLHTIVEWALEVVGLSGAGEGSR